MLKPFNVYFKFVCFWIKFFNVLENTSFLIEILMSDMLLNSSLTF